MAELRCHGLAKAYGERMVLADVDLVVPPGTLTAILGASGSGKTTLLRLLIGFIAADRGTVSIGSNTVAEAGGVHVRPDRRAIGYVAQEGALFPHLTVAENVGFGLVRSERKRGARIDAALDLVGLDRSYGGRQPHELSGGEQRRVGLARALAPNPSVVLLDEPFSGLDAGLRAETRAAVLDAMTRAGATGVLVTHDQAEALSMGREVAVLQAGRLVQTAAPADLYWMPADLEVAGFVGDAVVVPGDAGDETVVCALGTLPTRPGSLHGPVKVMIRPEQIRVGGQGEGAGVAARVVSKSFYGPDTMVHLELVGNGGLLVTARMLSADAAEAGDEVMLAVVGPVAVYPRTESATA
jgi:iron(III) transport system ATP-binding protein